MSVRYSVRYPFLDTTYEIRYPGEPDSDKETRQKIAEKIAPMINTVEGTLTINFNTDRQDIAESIVKNYVTNLWFEKTDNTVS